MDVKMSRLTTYCALYTISSVSLVYAEFCKEYGHSCPEGQLCCDQTCCVPPGSGLENHYHAHLRWSVWNMWYFWFVVLFVLMSCFGGCSYYRRHQLLMARHQSMMGTGENNYNGWRFPPAFPVSLFTGYGGRNNQHENSATPIVSAEATTSATQQCGAFPTPPPYSEVVSQPDMYPCNKHQEVPPYPWPKTTHSDATPVLPAYSAATTLPPYSARSPDACSPQQASHGLTSGHNSLSTDGATGARSAADDSGSVLPPGGRTDQN